MIFAKQNGVSCYQFNNLSACCGIEHRVFTRNCGYSQPPFDSLNVSFGIGDAQKSVTGNRGIISRCMGSGELVFTRQVHGREVAVLGREIDTNAQIEAGRGLTADAMVTDVVDRYLVIQVADCQAVLLYEPSRRVVANVHCGWRGSIQNIIGRTVEVMKQDFGCRPELVIAGIGPSLGPCCAEFINYDSEIPMEFWPYKNLNRHFDFWSLSEDQLKAAGVAEKNIESSRICTRCHANEFFSYRAEKTTGRFAAAIGLREMPCGRTKDD